MDGESAGGRVKTIAKEVKRLVAGGVISEFILGGRV